MQIALQILYIVVCALIIALVLLQGKGAGMGSAWGGGGEFYQARRGVEKLTIRLLVGLVVVFFLISVVNLLK